MWRSALGLSMLVFAGAAGAQPYAPPAESLRNAAFTSPAAAGRADPRLEQRLRRDSRVFVFAGARGAETFQQGDPRWSPRHDSGAGASLVETKVGVGWRRGGVETSLGYMKRQITDAPALYGDKPRKDSMVGVSFKLRPNL